MPNLHHENQKLRGIVRGLLVVSCLSISLTPTSRGETIIAPGIGDPGSSYAGKTYSEWSAAWWRYLMSLPTTNNPLLYNPAHPFIPMSTGQRGTVWFTGGDFGGKAPNTQNYTNTIPGDVSLFVGIESFESDNANCPNPGTANTDELLTNIRAKENSVTNTACTIDDFPVVDLTNVMTTPYRVQASFDFSCPAVHNYPYDFDTNGDLSCYQNISGTPYVVSGAASDGVFLMIAPLMPGSHVIHYE
jgi:hypothetical protein